MPQRKLFVATEILVFDFELFIGDRCDLLSNIRALCAKSDEQGAYTNVDRDRRSSRASSVADLLREHGAKELDSFGHHSGRTERGYWTWQDD
jgi:hypothetical protein